MRPYLNVQQEGHIIQILMRLKKCMKLRFIIRHVFSGHMSYVTLFQCSLERSRNADLTVIEKKPKCIKLRFIPTFVLKVK